MKDINHESWWGFINAVYDICYIGALKKNPKKIKQAYSWGNEPKNTKKKLVCVIYDGHTSKAVRLVAWKPVVGWLPSPQKWGLR